MQCLVKLRFIKTQKLNFRLNQDYQGVNEE